MSLCVVWEFRANADMFSDEHVLSDFLHKIAKKFSFQLEKGNENDYLHWQGRMSLFKKKRKPELMSMIIGMDEPVFNYLEPTTNTEHQKTAFYTMKEDTRVKGPWTDKDEAAYIPKQYRNIELYDWQQELINSANDFDCRRIDCIVDIKGCNGKSTIASLGDLKYNFIDLPLCHDGQKIIESTCDILIAKQCRKPKLMFFDMPRAFSKDKMNGIYTALETIKKGKVWDMRHSYKEWWFDSPRLWIFSNEYPDDRLLSRDRWKFWSITDDKKFCEYKGNPINEENELDGKNVNGKFYKEDENKFHLF
jgi:hypothetical protein